MPKNRLKSVNRLGTTMTTRRIPGPGNRLMARTSRCSSGILREQRGARADPVPHHDPHGGPGRDRQEHVPPRPQADHSQPPPLTHVGSRLPLGDDAAGGHPPRPPPHTPPPPGRPTHPGPPPCPAPPPPPRR